MNSFARAIIVGVVFSAGSMSAVAGVNGLNGSTTLWGRSYDVARWDLAGDLGVRNNGLGNRTVVAEASALRDGVLYVGGDDDAGQFEDGRILSYNVGTTGNLGSASIVRLNNASGQATSIGPEALTFGSGPELLAFEGSGSSTTGIGGLRRASINLSSNPAISTETAVNFEVDDATYLPGSNRFAILQKLPGNSDLRGVQLYDASFNLIPGSSFITEGSVLLPRGGRAMSFVSAAFVNGLAGLNLAGGEFLLIPSDRRVGTENANSRRIGIYSLTGQLVASTLMQLPSTVGDIQGIAIDEASNKIYFGDQGQRVWVVTVPTPGTVAGFGLLGLVAARRRRG